MNIKASRFLLPSLIISSLTSCGTTTRLGDLLVPAHEKSYKKEGEKVQLTISTVDSTSKTYKQLKPKSSGGRSSSALAGLLIDQANQRIQSELKREAKKYSQQYSVNKRLMLKDSKSAEVYRLTVIRSVKLSPNAEASLAAKFEFDLFLGSYGKKSYGFLDLKSVQIKNAKAKIVSWNKNPMSWIAGLVLKTGETVNVEVDVKLKGLSDAGQTVILDSNYFPEGLGLSLKGEKAKNYKELGEYFVTGRSSLAGIDYTPLVFNLTITETDPSNVQKKLTTAQNSIDKRASKLKK